MAVMKRWRKKQFVALAALVLLAIPLLPLLVFRFSAENRLQTTLARHPDLPRSMEQIAARHTAASHPPATPRPTERPVSNTPPESQPDPATALQECREAVEVPKEFWGEWWLEWIDGRLTPESRAQLDALRSQYRDFLDSLLSMPGTAMAGLPLGDLNDKNSAYWGASHKEMMITTLLGIEAESAAKEGDYARMAAAFRAMAAINDVLRQTPSVHVRSQAFLTRRSANAALQHILAGGGLPNSALEAIEPYIQVSAHEDVLREALLTHRDIGQLYVGEPMRFFERFGDADTEPLTRLAFQALTAGSNATGWTANDQTDFLDRMDELIAIAEAPQAELSGRLNTFWASFLQSRRGTLGRFHLSNSFLWDSAAAVDEAFRAEMESETLRTALAVERYRNDTGQLPVSIEVLKPRYLSAIPMDRFSGEPIRYRPDGAGYVVYSAGLDGLDDGGRGGSVRGPNDDIAFRVKPEKSAVLAKKM